jgi:hypothetical protein
MGQFDQTARDLSKMDGLAFFTWALACDAPELRLSFLGWEDTRQLVRPGEPDRTNDLVAQLRDEQENDRPIWLIGEIEVEPEKGILYRLGQYELNLGKEVNPDCDPDGPRVGSLLINLTGTQKVRRLDGSWAKTDRGTRLAPFVVDVAKEDAALTLAKIEVGLLGPPIAPYVVLMRGRSDPKLIERWPDVVAEKEPDIARRVRFRDAALVFAELTRAQVSWLRILEDWQMRESQYIKKWESVGEDRGSLRTKRADLLNVVKFRLEDPVPEPIRLAIEGTNDLNTLDRWLQAAATLDTIVEFRKAMNLVP